MEFLYEIGLFVSKGVVVVIAIVFVIMAIASAVAKKGRQGELPVGHLVVRHVNEFYKELKNCIDVEHFDPRSARKAHKAEAKARKAEAKQRQAEEKAKQKEKKDAPQDESLGSEEPSGVYVLDFKGDIEASKVELLRNEINAVLVRSKKPKEVVVRVESSGGYVHSYGLAASQLLRIKEAGIRLTVAVDQVAASGGYMMAAVADRIIAAPFAVIGSIGVAAELPNVHRLLKKYDVDYEVLTAGKYKRTMTVFGENTDEHREKLIADMEDTHALFQDFVAEYRLDADVPEVATGETWYGSKALDLKLIDEIKTSDQYIMEASNDESVYELHWVVPKRPFYEVTSNLSSVMSLFHAWVKRWLKFS